MRVLVTRIHLQLAEHRITELRLREHPANGFFHHAHGLGFAHDLGAILAQAAGIPAVALIDLLFFLAARQLDLGHVEDDDVIARVQIGRVSGFVFALKQFCGIGGNAAEHLAIGINHMPLGGHRLHGWYVSWHPSVPLTFLPSTGPYRLRREDGKPKSYTDFGGWTS